MGGIPFTQLMNLKTLLTRADKYAKRAKLRTSTVSRLIFDDGKRIDALKTGKSRCWPDTLQKAADKLASLEASLEREAA